MAELWDAYNKNFNNQLIRIKLQLFINHYIYCTLETAKLKQILPLMHKLAL